jgi:uncharacterized protein
MGFHFDWDKTKAATNIKKHGIAFEEARTVFGDFHSITIPDPLHSKPKEDRFITTGTSYRHKLLVVVHCDRGDNIRIISARKATKREAREYEEAK